MKTTTAMGLSLALMAAAGSAAGDVGQTGARLPDSLTKPSAQSALAAQSMLSAVTRAGQRLVAVGERGHIVLSDDQGRQWTQAQVPVSVTLTAVCFVDDQHGWAVGHRGVILHSEDAGANWTLQLDGVAAAEAVLDEARRQDSELLASAEMLVAEGADKPFLDVLCVDRDTVLAVGAYGMGFRTLNAGNDWQPMLTVLEGSDQRHINAIRASHGGVFLAGEQGGLYRSASDLDEFIALDEPYEGSFFGLLDTADGSLLAFGLRGNLFRSSDQGQSWEHIEVNTSQSLTAGIRLKDGATLLVDASGTGWLSRDDGLNFSRVQPTRHFPFTALVAIGDDSVLAVGLRGTSRFQLAASGTP